ncbi:MAG: hypothetical protein ABJ360_22465 [Roseobacter sp.]
MKPRILNAKIHTFERSDRHDGGANWIAQFYPYSKFPVTFYGVDEQTVIEKAEAMRTEALQKHEAECARRGEAKKRKAKKVSA